MGQIYRKKESQSRLMIYACCLAMDQPNTIRSSHWATDLQKLYVHRQRVQGKQRRKRR